MKKRFNITGICIKEKHYMVNIDKKLEKIIKLIDYGDYFVINRPRQYGKTTTLNLLNDKLYGEYMPIFISFEGMGDIIFSSEKVFCNEFISLILISIRKRFRKEFEMLNELKFELNHMNDLSFLISEFIEKINKKVVLIIDEVDKSSNNQLFLNFLGLLRSKYLMRHIDESFHSVILSGVHNIKNLKLKVRNDEEEKQNSPWNIAVDFNIDMSFNQNEISSMLIDYSSCENINIDIEKISERIYFYSNGYPYLVSKICYLMNENFRKDWNLDNIDKVIKLILNESNTLFESLIKNLENSNEFKNFIEKIILSGKIVLYSPSDPLITMGIMYGFLKEEDGRCKINNRIFEQYLYNHLTFINKRKEDFIEEYNFKDKFITKENGLNFEKILLKFQGFMKKEYSNIDKRFIEREGRLLFLAFIKPIINGVGFDFKEVVISEEKRLDIVVTYNEFKYLVELKIWYGESYHQKGIKQLCDYLDKINLQKGYLLIYNFNKEKEYKEEKIFVENKEIFIVYV